MFALPTSSESLSVLIVPRKTDTHTLHARHLTSQRFRLDSHRSVLFFVAKVDIGLTYIGSSPAPKDSPPSPTLAAFPKLLSRQPNPEHIRACNLVKLLCAVPKSGPTEIHFNALNVEVNEGLSIKEIVPEIYLAPLAKTEPQQEHSQSSSGGASDLYPSTPSDSYNALDLDEYRKRAEELRFDNEDVFRYLEHRQPFSQNIVKTGWFRRFWEKLLLVAEYWDTSTDGLHGNPDPQTGKTYLGRRIFKGQDMPLVFLEDAIKEFCEAISWAWRCRYIPPNIQPRLEIGNLRIPVPQTGAVFRTPRDPSEARKGFAEGPLIGVLVTTNPSLPPDEGDGTPTRSSDDYQTALKEVSLAIMLAQKRARQGHQEVPAGKGKWWTEKPRWGGGPGGQIGIFEQSIAHLPNQSAAKRARDLAIRRYKRRPVPCSTWDRGIIYRRIGKDSAANYDDVRQFSTTP